MELKIKNNNETFSSWLNKEFITTEIKTELLKASILIVPFENLRETENPLLFPIGTENILNYFKQNLPDGQIIDICIPDELYQEFAFYSDYKRLGNFVIKSVVVPVFVGLLTAYIYDQYIKEDENKPNIVILDKSTNTTINNHISELSDKKYLEPTHIKFSVTVVDTTGSSKNINFEGPATKVEDALKALKDYEK